MRMIKIISGAGLLLAVANICAATTLTTYQALGDALENGDTVKAIIYPAKCTPDAKTEKYAESLKKNPPMSTSVNFTAYLQ